MTAKTCKKCGEEKQLHLFYRSKNNKDGLHGSCKTCMNAQSASARSRWVEKSRGRVPKPLIEKVCTDCGLTQSIDEFQVRSDSRDGYKNRCRSCIRRHARAYESANEDAVRAVRAAYRSSHRAERADYASARQKSNPEKGAEASARYRARKAAATVEVVNYQVVASTHGRWCYLCESRIRDDESMDVDHVVPLNRGGPHSYANVRPTHATCNRSKNDSFLHELDLPFVPPHLKVVS